MEQITNCLRTMKEKIIQSLSDLLCAESMEERLNLHSTVADLLVEARFDLESESELHTKNLIISTIKNYVDTSDTNLKNALAEHIKIIESHLVEAESKLDSSEKA